jgi:hypothetical protein
MRTPCWTPPGTTRGEDQDVICAANVDHGWVNTPLHRAAASAAFIKTPTVVSTSDPPASSSMSASQPRFDRDEVIVCMLMAVCIGSAILGVIYRVMT